MMNWLRDKVRAWLGVAVATAAVDAQPEGALSIAQNMFVQAGERFLVNRKIQPPVLPPMVRGNFAYNKDNDPGALGAPMLAMDDGANAPMWAYLNQVNCGMGFPGYPYLSELSQRSEYRAPCETLANESTREWIDITVRGKASKKKRKERGELTEDEAPEGEVDADGDGDVDGGLEDKLERLEAAFERLRVRDHFRKIAELDGLMGRSQLFIDVDTGNKDADEVRQLPLVVDPETIPKGSLKGFKVIEPIWTTPYSYNASDPTAPDFYKPRAWFVMGKRIHSSRLLTFISREVPDMLKPAYNFGGLSMSQLMEPYVFQWLRTKNSVSDLVHNFSVMVLATDMAAVLTGDTTASEGFFGRIKLFTQTRDNQGLTVLDKTREELKEVHASLANLDKLQAQAQEHMAAVCHEPLVILTGITPAGLNANSEGEIQVWHNWVRAFQLFFFGTHLKHVLDVVQLSEFGEIDDAISFQFVPLNTPTVKELSEIRKADAETDDKYVAMGAVSPDEVRERVAADPNSGYNNLSGPAPGPPEQGLMETEHELGQAGAEADHERGKETAEEGHKRKLAEIKTAAAVKPKPKPPGKK